MTGYHQRDPYPTLRFTCPGGRLGIPRLRALADLLKQVPDLSLMVTRRQSLAVRGNLEDVPGYLLDELRAEKFTGPNLKSYPVTSSTTDHTILSELHHRLESSGSLTRFSYSPAPYFRGVLRRDDLCLSRLEDNRFQLDSGAWGEPPLTLVPPFQPDFLTALFDVVERVLLDDEPPGQNSPREVRQKLLSDMNREPREAFSPGTRSTRPVHEECFVGGETRARETIVSRGGLSWILCPLFCGILELEFLTRLVEVVRNRDIQALRLTPEQNLLVPCDDEAKATDVLAALLEPLPRSASSVLSRITTCPGARFCGNVELKPTKLALTLQTTFDETASLHPTAERLPIAITGCGETEHLERLHPIGMAPHESHEGFTLYLGGVPHGEGQPGRRFNGPWTPSDLPGRLTDCLTEFQQSQNKDFRSWVDQRESGTD